MSAKTIIGVLPLWDDEKESYWMLPGYMNGIVKAGGIPIMLPMTDDEEIIKQFIKMCDGFLFTGGHDVSPEIYKSEVLFDNIECCAERDKMELILLEKALKEDKAILGICRGIQFINAALGGTLYQDLPREHKSNLDHHQEPPYDIPIHTVTINHGTPLHNLLGMESIEVNSYHHQAVKKLSDRLCVMAKAEDGLIEAAYMPDKKFVRAVQWHPEFSYLTDENSMKIFREFVLHCR